MNTNKTLISKILDDGSPFIIWEKKKRGEFKRGMILDTWVCDNPECRYLHIQAIAIDERFKNMKFKGEKFIYTVESEKYQKGQPLPVPDQHLSAGVHIDSSEVSVPAGTPPEKQNSELFTWLTEEVKGDLFEVMKRRWHMAKKVDRDQWRKMDWSWLEDGMMVGWDEVFPNDPDFVFDLSGKRYWVRDQYCITPGCPCKDVTLSFTELEDEKKYKELGNVTIDVKRFRIDDTKPIGASSEKLMQLWRIFQKESKIKKTLRTRQSEMKIVGKEIAKLGIKNRSQAHKSFSKVGRNDPCPCGSGKKYKKCCLNK
jgi:hypothetical protein